MAIIDGQSSSTSIIDHEVSEARLQSLHRYILEKRRIDVTLSETRTFLDVFRADALVERAGEDNLEDFHKRVIRAFPMNKKMHAIGMFVKMRTSILSWRTLEKLELGEQFRPEDAREVQKELLRDSSGLENRAQGVSGD